MAEGPEYLILKPGVGWISGEYWKNLLGAAVKYPFMPLRDYVPDDPPYMQYAPDERLFDDMVLRQNIQQTKSGHFSVTGLGELRTAESANNQLNLQGKLIYIKSLQQHDAHWENIIKIKTFRQKVTKWLRERTMFGFGAPKHQVCLVVGILLCQDVSVAISKEEETKFEAGGQLPLGTVAEAVTASRGAPIQLKGAGNVVGGASTTTAGKKYFGIKGKEIQIFGLELRIISLRDGALSLSDDTPKARLKLMARSVLSGFQPSDLELRKLGREDWDVLLKDEP
ncbi:hypothetical protein BBO_09559 [Beauveria brongniartii RCEF 3172]|uniref:Uncharacterized protein n=1 Tax=Beauveria brongniartii RCEF 3172 TaxID=1081107 RepID=A0A167Z157_9HYPO|nr:hypothetical protein BBO_09559 [Beauveria brongniartii RCEF 3172]